MTKQESFAKAVLAEYENNDKSELEDIILITLNHLKRHMVTARDGDTDRMLLQVDREFFDAISGKLKTHKSKPINEFLR
jgi:hypothetical protein